MNPFEILNLYFDASQIPIFYFRQNQLIQKFSHDLQDFNLPLLLLNSLPNTLPPIWYSHTPEYMYFGGICLPLKSDVDNISHGTDVIPILDRNSILYESSNSIVVLLGPVLLSECSHKKAEEICRHIGRRKSDTPGIHAFLLQTRTHSVQNFLANLQILCQLLNLNIPQKLPQIPFRWKMPYPAHIIPEDTAPADDTRDFEHALLACITSGNMEALNQTLHTMETPDSPSKNTLSLTDIRGCTLGVNALLSRAASTAGIGYDAAFSIYCSYMNRIMQATTREELSEIFFQLVYSYAQKVSDLYILPSNSPVVDYIQKYTAAHYDVKITPAILAEQLHMSCPYLCRIFKQETGMTISTYVNRQKIREAKRLLQGSPLSALEISEMLAFSSESYFGAVFKKITGMTPMAYRESCQK